MLRRSQSGLVRASVRLASTKAKVPLVSSSHNSENGVLTFNFENEKKLNAWTLPLMSQMKDELARANTRSDVTGVVLTGSGKYYSAGVDLSSLLKPMAPSKLLVDLRANNQQLFDMFINFSKPIGVAVNGPAIGAAVTTATLTDVLVASDRASFSLPFAKVGVPAEGCSSVTFAEWMGEATAERMLGTEGWIPTAAEAKAVGFPITEIVEGDNDAVVARAVELVAAQTGRRFDAAEAVRLRKINAEESARLANAVVSEKFLDAMRSFNEKRSPKVAFFFSAAKATLPLWQPAPIQPNYHAEA